MHVLSNPGRTRSWRELVDEARRRAEIADELGLDGMWFGEHHFDASGFDACPNPVMLAADLAGRTTRLRLGLAAVTLTLWHPVRLAEDLSMLDQFSDGRLDVAFSRGILAGEILNLNPDADRADEQQSRAIFAENLEIVKRAWTTDPFSWHGERYRIPWPGSTWPGKAYESYHDQSGQLTGLAVIPQPLQRPTPPLYAVSENATGFRIAAQQGLGTITAFPTRGVLATMRRAYFDEAERIGLPSTARRSALSKSCCIADTDTEARQITEANVISLFELIKQVRGLQAWLDEGEDPDDPRLNAMNGFELMLERDHLMIGSPESVTERLIRLHERHNLEHIILSMGRLRPDQADRSMRLLAEEVIPAVRRAVATETPTATTATTGAA
jgi:alkanesulfonate monooxygenase SsuD/methylene tetrahydromethanopterin reductase-like flavin-dependent oxidoreductase (luciferase family)